MTDLSNSEIESISGGYWQYALLAYEIYNHADDFVALGQRVYSGAKAAGEWVATH